MIRRFFARHPLIEEFLCGWMPSYWERKQVEKRLERLK